MKIAFFCNKRRFFIKKLPIFIKSYIGHTYKKLQPQISAFIKKTPFLELIETPGGSTLIVQPDRKNTVFLTSLTDRLECTLVHCMPYDRGGIMAP